MEVAILGAGVAGLSTALALSKQGHRIRLYERRSATATMGAGVVLWPNAGFVLSKLGVWPEIIAVSGHPVAMRRFDRHGDALGHIDIRHLNRRMGFASCAILRRELQAVLLAAVVARGVEVRFDCGAQAIEARPEGATVRCDNGERIAPDLVIGADGRMRSVARRYVVGDTAPVYQGFVNWIGVAHAASPLFDDVAISDYWGIGERFGIVALDRHRAYWAAAAVEPADALVIDDQLHPMLVERFTAWAPPIGAVIHATSPDAIRKIRVHDLDPVEVWHRDNVVLIGDAAHAPLPTSGQGACQALEDAWHLAACLEAEPVDRALASFCARRRRKTAAITLRARDFARVLFSQDADVCRARDEQARHGDPIADSDNLATAWGAGLPLAVALNV